MCPRSQHARTPQLGSPALYLDGQLPFEISFCCIHIIRPVYCRLLEPSRLGRSPTQLLGAVHEPSTHRGHPGHSCLSHGIIISSAIAFYCMVRVDPGRREQTHLEPGDGVQGQALEGQELAKVTLRSTWHSSLVRCRQTLPNLPAVFHASIIRRLQRGRFGAKSLLESLKHHFPFNSANANGDLQETV